MPLHSSERGPALSRPRLASWLKLAAWNAAIVLLLCEAASLAWLYTQEKALYYLRAPLRAPLRWKQRGDAGTQATDLRLHPFLGYRYVNGEVNDRGFVDSHDYPWAAPKDQVVVGVFGGSFADLLSRYEASHHVLAERLRGYPAFRDKEIVVLNFAVGAYKQPQQLLALSYFLMLGQRFDLVVDISGFNEVAVANFNRQAGVALAMPDIKLMLPLAQLATNQLSVEQLEQAASAARDARSAVTAFERAESCWLASCNVALKAYAARAWRRGRESAARFEAGSADAPQDFKGSLLHIDPLGFDADDKDRAFREMASIWAESLRMMDDLCRGRGIPFFAVLQPNQYAKTARVFTPEEKRDAIAETGRYRAAVEAGYPRLVESLDGLRSQRIRVLDARTIVDDERKTVYDDNCCHLNDRGHERVARRIGDWIAESLAHESAPARR